MRSSLLHLRVGRLPYLNVHPFHAGYRGPAPTWVTAVPRRLGKLAALGALDAALLASRDAMALEGVFRPLSNLGIACRGPVRSVLLFSRVPMQHLAGQRVALPSQSRTSRGLLRVLLAGRYGIDDVRWAEGHDPADACLVIGDRALSLRANHTGSHVYDLGEVWTDWTGLPFVFGRWVVRHDVPPALATRLGAALERALEAPLELTGVPLPSGMNPATARTYLDRFVYRMGRDEEAGLRRFRLELEKHDLLGHHRSRPAIESAA